MIAERPRQGDGMRALARRLHKLEELAGVSGMPRQRMRLVILTVGRTRDLARCTCRRTLAPNGLLTEFVDLDGASPEWSDEDIDRFVARFPIQRCSGRDSTTQARRYPGVSR
jgi:hypothetical protein